MRRHPTRLGAAVVACALLAAASRASAAEPVLTPPTVLMTTPPEDPRTSASRARVVVELELELDREGAVTQATVLRSDESERSDEIAAAAVGAARLARFAPATRDGVAIPARVRFQVVFEPRAEAPPPSARPSSTPGSIAGVALDAESSSPIGGAKVVVTTEGGATFQAVTDASGAFRVDGVPAGPVHVVIDANDHVPARLDESLEPGTLVEAKLRLEKTPDPEAFVATARVEAPPREVTKRSLDRAELTRIAGTRGDALRGVELLPGVGRAGDGQGAPILRGASSQDSQTFIDGTPVPYLYHLGGVSSVLHSRIIDTIDLYPSGFGVRYGRKIGGVIEARLRDPRTDGLHGIADISLIDSSLLVEAPLGEHFAVLGAVRRSNIDAVLSSGLGDAGQAITVAPVYWDYQAVAAYRPTEADRLRLTAYGASDRLAMVLKKPADDDPTVRGAFDASDTFHRVQLGYRHRWSSGSEQNTELSYGHGGSNGTFGQIAKSDFVIDQVQLRSEWTSIVSPELRLTAGLDLLSTHYDGGYSGVPLPSGEGDGAKSLAAQQHVSLRTNTWIDEPGAYVEAGVRPIPRLLLTPGVRADYDDQIRRGSVDPRFSSRIELDDATALKAGVGRFSQSPFPGVAAEPLGNPNLGLARATHLTAGVERKIGEAVTVSVEGFGKWLDHMVVATPDYRAPVFVDERRGRVYGGELFARVRPIGRFFGFVSYTLMRSERKDPGQGWRPFDRDQTHMVSATAVYRIGRGWEVGASWRFQSGVPYTPIVASTYDANSDVYLPRSGPVLSARNPAFSRLDVRVEKKWTFTRWSLATYLDVQNVMSSENAEGFRYSYDYRRREAVRGLPILPSLGVRGEL